jgi:hypothetical protein
LARDQLLGIGGRQAGDAGLQRIERLREQALPRQAIGVDQHGNRCWVRRWPMARHGSPVFEISLHLVDGLPNAGPAPARLNQAGS